VSAGFPELMTGRRGSHMGPCETLRESG
jgi:hypothetical protein